MIALKTTYSFPVYFFHHQPNDSLRIVNKENSASRSGGRISLNLKVTSAPKVPLDAGTTSEAAPPPSTREFDLTFHKLKWAKGHRVVNL